MQAPTLRRLTTTHFGLACQPVMLLYIATLPGSRTEMVAQAPGALAVFIVLVIVAGLGFGMQEAILLVARGLHAKWHGRADIPLPGCLGLLEHNSSPTLRPLVAVLWALGMAMLGVVR